MQNALDLVYKAFGTNSAETPGLYVDDHYGVDHIYEGQAHFASLIRQNLDMLLKLVCILLAAKAHRLSHQVFQVKLIQEYH